jgi:antitoxin component YwqK of YwqJK toxin-antitoxin module
MRIILTGLLSIMLCSAALAQKDTIHKWLDAELNFTNKKNGIYPAIIFKQENHWQLRADYPAGTTAVAMSFKDPELTIRDGHYIRYYPALQKAEEGNFVNNMQEGVWQNWYPNGNGKDSGTFKNNLITGTWVMRYFNGKPEAIIFFNGDSADVKESSWFREDGSRCSKEKYVNDKLVSLECFDEKGDYAGATCSVLKPPVFIHPFFSVEEFIIDKLHRNPNKHIKNEGEASLSFTVTKSGKIEKLEVTNSPDTALTNNIIKIMAAMPAWSPAITHNRIVDFPMQLVIPFYRGKGD